MPAWQVEIHRIAAAEHDRTADQQEKAAGYSLSVGDVEVANIALAVAALERGLADREREYAHLMETLQPVSREAVETFDDIGRGPASLGSGSSK